MNHLIRYGTIVLMTFILIPCLDTLTVCVAKDKNIDICNQVSTEQLAKLYRKPLHSTKNNIGCYWSEKPGGMAYFDIGLHKQYKDLRDYWNKELSSNITLEKINDLGDDGLMAVSEGDLGVIIIRKNEWILRSAVTFLDIEPGSEKHKVLWEIYRGILKNIK